MIRVVPASAPEDFDTRVKNRGLDAIAELVGERPKGRRRGPRRKKAAETRDQIPSDYFPPLWRDVLPDMLHAYSRFCAYLSLYIEHATGSPTVDHVIPRSKSWDKVYEWSNYRLACALVNSKKNDVALVLDRFEIEDGSFALEFFEFQVKAGATAVGELEAKVVDTIERLGLNRPECCKARREYFENYKRRDIKLDDLERRAPVIARELRRQGLLNEGDA
jgi:5-methylcytosine-specific restriction endonuclease McrA